MKTLRKFSLLASTIGAIVATGFLLSPGSAAGKNPSVPKTDNKCINRCMERTTDCMNDCMKPKKELDAHSKPPPPMNMACMKECQTDNTECMNRCISK